MKIINSAILYRGPSLIDGAPILAIISGIVNPSDNAKTGAMAQVDIIREDEHPLEAIESGADYSICGNCPFRLAFNPETGKWERVCYVNLYFGPASKFRASVRGSYSEMAVDDVATMCNVKERGIRLGAYGDPASIPYETWDRLVQLAGTFHTGYTHHWMEPWFDKRLFKYAMASIDHVNTVEKLRELYPGEYVRHYRVSNDYSDLQPDEIKCPSKNAQGERVVTCEHCGLCAGTSLIAKNIVIVEGE